MTRRYLLDSGPAQNFALNERGMDARVQIARRAGARVGVCAPVLGELLAGLEGSASAARIWPIAERRLRQLACWPYEYPAAVEYGRLASLLRQIGRPMQSIDIQLAAIALTLGDCVVVTGDSDLLAVPGLTVENWAEGEA